jgi:hypothetical protein
MFGIFIFYSVYLKLSSRCRIQVFRYVTDTPRHTVLPWGHLAFGYLVYSLGQRAVRRRPPTDLPTIALVVGTQLPDLVDKPLNWWFGVFDGRGAGHSLLVMGPCCLLVYLLARRYGYGRLAGGFVTGVLTHLFSDAWLPILAGDIQIGAPYLLWPLLPAPTYEKDSLLDHAVALEGSLRSLPWDSPVALLSTWFGAQLGIMLLLVSLWVYDGVPGLRVVTGGVRTLRTRV